MNIAVTREGKALLYIPDPTYAKQGDRFEPAWLPVFYNPIMEFNRDLGILVLDTYLDMYAPHTPIKAIDPLSGTGIRAFRILREIDKIEKVYVNDIDPSAFKLIKANAKLNRLDKKVTIWHLDANAALNIVRTILHEPILYVDIDPFGSPAPFAKEALQTTGHMGLAAFTATDLGVLEGGKTRPALRKYWTNIIKVPESKEIGLRALLGYLARVAASVDKSIKPLLSYYADHYFRVYVLVQRGSKNADNMLKENIGYATYCKESKKTFLNNIACPLGEKGKPIGPLWIGELGDKQFIQSMISRLEKFGYLHTTKRIQKLLTTILDELHVCKRCVHYRIDSVASAISSSMPPREHLLNELRKLGYRVSRTHFTPIGIRTNAPYSIISYMISSWYKQKANRT